MTGRGTRGTWHSEYTAFDPPKRISATFWRDGGSEGGATTYVLEEADQGTRVQMEGDAQIGTIAALGVALIWPVYRWSIRRGNRKLSRLIEDWSPPSDKLLSSQAPKDET